MTAKFLALSAFIRDWLKPKRETRTHVIFVDREGVAYLPSRRVVLKAKI